MMKLLFLIPLALVASTPAWMQEGIARDLASFGEFCSDDITTCLQKLKEMQGIENAQLVRIRNSSVEPLFSLTLEQRTRLDVFLSALQRLSLPPLDLVLTLAPSFDRPLLLQATTIPILAVSKERHNRKVILIPNFWRLRPFPPLIPWSEKIEKALWRGAPSDGVYSYFDWDCRPRARLVFLSCHHRDLLDAALVPSPLLNSYMTDWLTRTGVLAQPLPPSGQATYKYLLSLDGAATPASFEWQLFSHSLVLKASSNRIEWFYHALSPGKHYLSFSTNPLEALAWAKAHDPEARAIADEAYAFATHHLRDDDLLDYLYHLLSAYSRKYLPTQRE